MVWSRRPFRYADNSFIGSISRTQIVDGANSVTSDILNFGTYRTARVLTRA